MVLEALTTLLPNAFVKVQRNLVPFFHAVDSHELEQQLVILGIPLSFLSDFVRFESSARLWAHGKRFVTVFHLHPKPYF